jgi:hypothetical protein
MDIIEDEKEIYKKQLESIEQELKEEANIYKIDGRWYF